MLPSSRLLSANHASGKFARGSAKGDRITFEPDGISVFTKDSSPEAFHDGGIALLVHEGALSSKEIRGGAV
ncbi:hypothetical protein [Mesorhizobium kowhaii]|uniref:hypothetical protein n=1 Tax=Mesorhizobium kowhaii TaxID=1300272 RepID=UPI000DAD7BA8|nr:hypothetical protein [Mesorhizobium kowhaii]